jgi:glycosyltransferase involved in cell wall biosynthesis
MNSHPSVTVIIPNFNYGHYLSESINSVLSQTYRNFELVVVNNGSTDESMEILKSFGRQIRVIDQQNLGQSGGRNSGMNAARGDFISFLDADDLWEKDKIEKQIELLGYESQLIYCGISRFNDNDVTSQDVILPKYRGQCSDDFLKNPGVSIVLSGESTAMFSKSLVATVGNFDLDLNSAAGWDFFRRCSKFTKFDFVDEPLVKYRIHQTNMSRSIQGNVEDIRKAYNKLLKDPDWNVSAKLSQEISRNLQFSFLKTYIKNGLLVEAAKELWNFKKSFRCQR